MSNLKKEVEEGAMLFSATLSFKNLNAGRAIFEQKLPSSNPIEEIAFVWSRVLI